MSQKFIQLSAVGPDEMLLRCSRALRCNEFQFRGINCPCSVAVVLVPPIISSLVSCDLENYLKWNPYVLAIPSSFLFFDRIL